MIAYRDFKHATPIDVRFGDLDSLNHVNNAVYLTYIETARINYVRNVLGLAVGFGKQSIILAKATLDFKIPILLEDKITVYTRCSRIGNKSFDLEYDLVKTYGDTLVKVAGAHTVLVAFDYEENQTIVIPKEWIQKISDYEGKNFE